MMSSSFDVIRIIIKKKEEEEEYIAFVIDDASNQCYHEI
jgi:hypothetical protein